MMRRYAAEKAITDPRYAIAKDNALKQQRRIDLERDEALSYLTDDDESNIRNSTHTVGCSISSLPKTRLWSCVFQNCAWKIYREHILRSSRLGFWAWQRAERVSEKWKIRVYR